MTDLRIIKTKKCIRDTFLKLRSKNALEKIKVKELCEIALINKTTFYKHYQSVFDLSEEIENETILSIMDSFEHMQTLLSDPEVFMQGLYNAFKSHTEVILILFSGRMNILIEKVEKQLIVHYPWINGQTEKEIALSFLLWGASHVLIESKYDEPILLDTLTMVAKQVILFMDTQLPHTNI